MNRKQGLFVVLGTVLHGIMATAGDMGPIASSERFTPVVSLQAGYASINAGDKTQGFIGTDSEVFTYINSNSGKSTGFIGIFLGAEQAFTWISRPGLFMQTGLEYNYFGKISITGINTVGVEPQTATTYQYNYKFQTQQVLGTVKLFATAYKRFYPYGEVGLGAAFNRAAQYSTATTETGSLNITPGFNNLNKTQFSYNLGLGLDTQLNRNIRVGFGYRYSNFGSSSLGSGVVGINNYQSPVPFALGSANTYANQLIAHISYMV